MKHVTAGEMSSRQPVQRSRLSQALILVLLALAGAWIAVVANRAAPMLYGQASLQPVRWLVPFAAGGSVAVAAVAIAFPDIWGRRVLPFVGCLVALGLILTSGSLAAFLSCFSVLVVSWSLGSLIIERLVSIEDAFEFGVLATASGLGCLSLAFLAIGLLGRLSPPYILALAGLVVVTRVGSIGILTAVQHLHSVTRRYPSKNPLTRIEALLLSLGAGIVILNLFGALAPEVTFDALKSHLALTRIFADSSSVLEVPYSIGSYWPLGAEVMFAVTYEFGGEIAPKLLHFYVGLLAAGAVFVLGKRLDSRVSGILAAVCLYAVPIFDWESTTADIDLFITLYVACAAATLAGWLGDRPRGFLVLTGVFLGFAFGIKPTAAFAAVGFGLAAIGFAKSSSLRDRLLAPFVLAAATGSVAFAWYLRTYFLTGNPVYPFLNGVFRSPLWPATNEALNFATFGVPTTPLSVARLPWNLTFHTQLFGEVPNGALGLALLALLPSTVLILVRKPRLVGSLLVIVLVFTVLLFQMAQYLRYLLPILTLACALVAAGTVCFARKIDSVLRGLGSTTLIVAAIVIAAGVPYNLLQYWNIPTRIPIDVVLGFQSRETYRAQILPELPALNYLNHLVDAKKINVYSGGEFFQYLADTPLITPFFSLEGNSILRAQSPDSLRTLLLDSQISYILVNRQALGSRSNDFLVFRRSFLDQVGQLKFAYGNVDVYQFFPNSAFGVSAQPGTACVETLIDSNFQYRDGPDVDGWHRFGNTPDPGDTASSNRGMITSLSTGFLQVVPVLTGRLYRLSADALAVGPGSQAQIQLIWRDRLGKPIDWSIWIEPATTSWNTTAMSVTAPESAEFAEARIFSYRGTVRFRSASLCRLGG